MDLSYKHALALDEQDTLNEFRTQFLIPKGPDGQEGIYLTGNSLGLQPKAAKDYLNEVLEAWAALGVEGHVEGKRPWLPYHEEFAPLLAPIVGALESEVVVMNSLTVNLHLLMASFYRPTDSRYKIICEAKAFPSDQYALQSQVQWHGYKPEDALVEVKPREGEHLIRKEDVLEIIDNHGHECALLMIGGVNYYTGQTFDMRAITKAAHENGIVVGWDLAHAAGNIPLRLHDWGVDFAAWCSYKYLNSGPGAIAGAFVHEKHHNSDIPRLAGWWGHKKENRFEMPALFEPINTAEAWQMSNPPIMAMAPQLASIKLFNEAGMNNLRKKSLELGHYFDAHLEVLMQKYPGKIERINPIKDEERGAQFSLIFKGEGKQIFDYLTSKGVTADWREPDVIRMAPVPLYNSFSDLWKLAQIIDEYYQTK